MKYVFIPEGSLLLLINGKPVYHIFFLEDIV